MNIGSRGGFGRRSGLSSSGWIRNWEVKIEETIPLKRRGRRKKGLKVSSMTLDASSWMMPRWNG